MVTLTWDGYQIHATNGSDINIVQAFDPTTGQYFASEDEAIAWIKQYLQLNGIEDIIASPIDELKTAKTGAARKAYATELAKGFDSEASGVLSHYAYDEAAATKLSKLFLLRANGMLTYPTTVFTVDNQMQSLSADQLTALLTDVSKFEWDIQLKLHNILVNIDACTTEEDLKNLIISF